MAHSTQQIEKLSYLVVYWVANWRFRSGSSYQSVGYDPVPVFEVSVPIRYRVFPGMNAT